MFKGSKAEVFMMERIPNRRYTRELRAEAVKNQVRLSDITYIRTAEGWLTSTSFLCFIEE